MERLPEPFVKRIRQQLGDETHAFLESFNQPPPVSIRRAMHKWVGPNLPYQDGVPWCPLGQYLPERPVFTLDPFFHAGAYYVQEASSMLLANILKQTTSFAEKYTCLDLCAAPGGKATLLRDWLGEQGVLVANDAIRSRIPPLRENLIRWGMPNVILANHDPEDFARRLPGWFDIVLVDAPCSGEGMFRKDSNAIREWSPENAALCAARQRRILTAARETVAPGGLLIYSTCTYNPQENDASVRFLKERGGLEAADVEMPEEWGIVRTEEGWQCWPHQVRGEGFYIAALRRNGERTGHGRTQIPVPDASALSPAERGRVEAYIKPLDGGGEGDAFSYFRGPDNSVVAVYGDGKISSLLNALPRSEALYTVGTFKGRDFIPSHALALTPFPFRNEAIPQATLNREQALAYLRKEPFDLPEGTPQGWVLATLSYGDPPASSRYAPGPGIGWLKVMPDRFNNYLPTDWRIRMRR